MVLALPATPGAATCGYTLRNGGSGSRLRGLHLFGGNRCNGNHKFTGTYKNLREVGYSAVGGLFDSQICVGVVYGYLKFNKNFCKNATLTVSSHPAGGLQEPVWGPTTHKVCGKTGQTVKTTFTPYVETSVSDFPAVVALSSTYQTRANHAAVSVALGPCPPCKGQ